MSNKKTQSFQDFAKKIKYAAVALVLAAPSFGHATTMEEAVEYALMYNPDVRVTVQNMAIAGTEYDEAFAGFLPSLDVSGAMGYERTSSPTTRASAETTKKLVRSEASLTLSQMLFDGFGTTREVDRREFLHMSSKHRLREKAQEIGLDAVEAYLEVLRRNRLLQIAKSNVKTHMDYLDMVTKRADAGGGSYADVRQAESRLGVAKTTVIQLQENLNNAEAAYIRIVGMAPSEMSRPTVEQSMLPQDVSDALDIALMNSPSLQAAQTDMDASQMALRAADAPYYPRFDLELGASDSNDLDGVEGRNKDMTALVRMRWNLYRGGADEARKSAALSRKARSVDVLERARRVASEDVRVAWNAMESANNRVETLKKVFAANIQVRDAYKQQFDLGQRSLLDLLDSENELFLSMSNLVTAEYTSLFGGYRVMSSVGNLTDMLNVRMPTPEDLDTIQPAAPVMQDNVEMRLNDAVEMPMESSIDQMPAQEVIIMEEQTESQMPEQENLEEGPVTVNAPIES